MKGGRFQFTHDQTKSLAALARIAKDMAERDLVLGDIWDIDGKQSYLDQLEREGVLPKKKPAQRRLPSPISQLRSPLR
jgi:Asp-tRNA(Asn)/Glu-tRNA(Gln) amidotransferase C subunit